MKGLNIMANATGNKFAMMTGGPPMNLPEIDFPIPPKENMKLVLEHKKPLWVPVMFRELNFCMAPADNERPPLNETGVDWFGTTWEFVESAGAQMSPPPMHICPDPRDWREKLIFPDLDKIDFTEGMERETPGVDNSEKMNMYIVQNGMFERLLDISDANELFVWLATEPEDAIEYANAMADYKIKLIDKIIDNWFPVDLFALSDDWGTQISTFISPAMWEEIFYGPTKRIADHIKSRGCYVNCHSCGKIEAIVPLIATFADLWEGQPMNDHVALKKKVGDRLAFTIGLNQKLLNAPDITEDQSVKVVRDAIDTYGENGGMILMSAGSSEFVTATIIRETFEYSRKKYASH